MDDKKQILEIANDIVNALGGGKCKECMWYDLVTFAHAEALYNAGYRKQIEGEWIPNPGGGWLCGNCKKYSHGLRNFCPECGAKMKGGAE